MHSRPQISRATSASVGWRWRHTRASGMFAETQAHVCGRRFHVRRRYYFSHRSRRLLVIQQHQSTRTCWMLGRCDCERRVFFSSRLQPLEQQIRRLSAPAAQQRQTASSRRVIKSVRPATGERAAREETNMDGLLLDVAVQMKTITSPKPEVTHTRDACVYDPCLALAHCMHGKSTEISKRRAQCYPFGIEREESRNSANSHAHKSQPNVRRRRRRRRFWLGDGGDGGGGVVRTYMPHPKRSIDGSERVESNHARTHTHTEGVL